MRLRPRAHTSSRLRRRPTEGRGARTTSASPEHPLDVVACARVVDQSRRVDQCDAVGNRQLRRRSQQSRADRRHPKGNRLGAAQGDQAPLESRGGDVALMADHPHTAGGAEMGGHSDVKGSRLDSSRNGPATKLSRGGVREPPGLCHYLRVRPRTVDRRNRARASADHAVERMMHIRATQPVGRDAVPESLGGREDFGGEEGRQGQRRSRHARHPARRARSAKHEAQAAQICPRLWHRGRTSAASRQI